jgi:hypothetical protein
VISIPPTNLAQPRRRITDEEFAKPSAQIAFPPQSPAPSTEAPLKLLAGPKTPRRFPNYVNCTTDRTTHLAVFPTLTSGVTTIMYNPGTAASTVTNTSVAPSTASTLPQPSSTQYVNRPMSPPKPPSWSPHRAPQRQQQAMPPSAQAQTS